MIQWVKARANKPDNLSALPGPTQWKQRQNSPKLSSVHHTCTRPFPAQSTKQKPTDQSIRYKTGEELVGEKQRVSGSPGISEGNGMDVNTTH